MSRPVTERVELTVDRPANGGEAVGRVDGRVVFVRGAIPGERVVAEIVDDRHESYRRAETVEILDPSPHRVPVSCPAAAHGAGCCDLAHVTPAHARTLKADVLADVLHRVGRLPAETIAATRLSTQGVEALGDSDEGWRIRTRLAVDAQGRAGQRAFRGAAVVVEPCVQPAPGLLDGLDEPRFTPGAELAVVLDAAGRRHVTELAPVERVRGGDARRRAQQNRRRRERPREYTVLEGDATAVQAVGARSWHIPVAGFWQAHRAAPRVYADTVVDLVATHLDGPARVAWDLYGGAGVFAGALVDTDRLPGAVESVHIVDGDRGAIAAAEATFAGDADRLHAHRGDVAAILADPARRPAAPDVVVLDPPRTGAGERVVAAIADAAPALVVHVGCDAARFARDLGLFVRHGYAVVEIRGFDAFPLTHHVEAIACLVRAGDA